MSEPVAVPRMMASLIGWNCPSSVLMVVTAVPMETSA